MIIEGQIYEFKKASNFRCSQIEEILSIDIFTDADKLSAPPFKCLKSLSDDDASKIAEIMFLDGSQAITIFPTLSRPDMAKVIMGFFLMALTPRVEINGELKPFEAIMKKAKENSLPTASAEMSQSMPSQAEIPKP